MGCDSTSSAHGDHRSPARYFIVMMQMMLAAMPMIASLPILHFASSQKSVIAPRG
jgi:hypothetical protein